jgi:hypothetical protein
MNYRLLVLPRTPRMTPKLLRKIRELIDAGATVIGNPPCVHRTRRISAVRRGGTRTCAGNLGRR